MANNYKNIQEFKKFKPKKRKKKKKEIYLGVSEDCEQLGGRESEDGSDAKNDTKAKVVVCLRLHNGNQSPSTLCQHSKSH